MKSFLVFLAVLPALALAQPQPRNCQTPSALCQASKFTLLANGKVCLNGAACTSNITYDGSQVLITSAVGAVTIQASGLANVNLITSGSLQTMNLTSGVQNSGSNSAFVFDTTSALSGNTTLFDWRNQGASKLSLTQGGVLTLQSDLVVNGIAKITAGGLTTLGNIALQIQSQSGQNVTIDSAGGTSSVLIGTGGATTTTVGRNGQTTNINGNVTFDTLRHDWVFSAFDPLSGVTTTGNVASMGPTQQAATLNDATYVQGVAGTGGTTQTIKLCDTSGCGAGVIYATCTPTCTSVAGTVSACTVNTAAVASGKTLFWAITSTTCTTDASGNLAAHFYE